MTGCARWPGAVLLVLACLGRADAQAPGQLPSVVPEKAAATPATERAAAFAYLIRQFEVAGGFAEQPARPPGAIPMQGGYLPLQAPVAAVARGLDVYIADAGINRILRFDITRQSLAPVGNLGVRPGMKLAVQPDGNLLVFDPGTQSLTRLSRAGVGLGRFDNQALLAGAVDMAIDEASGTVWLADQAQGRLVQVRGALVNAIAQPPTGAGAVPIQPVAMASAAGVVYLLDAAARDVVEIGRDGAAGARYGEDVLKQPRALAVDRHRRVFVADGFDQTMHVFFEGRQVAQFSAAALGARELRDVRIHEDMMAITDLAARRVLVFRVRAPVGPK